MDMHLNPESGDQQSRKIYAEYVCRSEDVAASGMSIGSGGASINLESTTGFWRAETAASEEQMDDGDTYKDDDPR